MRVIYNGQCRQRTRQSVMYTRLFSDIIINYLCKKWKKNNYQEEKACSAVQVMQPGGPICLARRGGPHIVPNHPPLLLLLFVLLLMYAATYNT